MEISSHRYFTITILTVWGHVTFKWQQGSGGGITLASFNSPSPKTSH